MKKCLINVEGGLGKHVMLTAILTELKDKGGYDELYVISPYFDVFKACEAVTDAFPPGQGGLYQELVLDPDCDILWKEPYSNQKFIKKQCHLFDAWAEEFGITLTKDACNYVPDLSKIESEFPHLRKIANECSEKWHHNFCIVQFTGGQSPLNPTRNDKGELLPYMNMQEAIKRNYYKGQAIIDLLHRKYPDTTVVHFALPNEPGFEGTERVEIPYLTYHLLAAEAKEIVCIDSSLQHLSTGVNDNITVIWGETRPEHFGYNCNHNIAAKHVSNTQPYFKPLGVSPSIVRMPEPEEIVKISDDEQQELGL
jgi:hypothetical protein